MSSTVHQKIGLSKVSAYPYWEIYFGSYLILLYVEALLILWREWAEEQKNDHLSYSAQFFLCLSFKVNPKHLFRETI